MRHHTTLHGMRFFYDSATHTLRKYFTKDGCRVCLVAKAAGAGVRQAMAIVNAGFSPEEAA